MEKQSRWSEQRSEQRVQQHSERREQVVQQRTEQHYTRQMLSQQGTSSLLLPASQYCTHIMLIALYLANI